MAGVYTISSDLPKVSALLSRLSDDLEAKAAQRAAVHVAGIARTAANAKIRETYNFRADVLRNKIKIERYTGANVGASIVCRSARTPLSDVLGIKQTREGVRITIKRGATKTIRGAFIATMPNGHVGVFERVGSGHKKVSKGGRTVWSGLPIRQLFTISATEAFTSREVADVMVAIVEDKFLARFQHELGYLFANA